MIRVRPAKVDGRIRAPPSKTHTHRAFILAALSGNGIVQEALESDDTRATLEALSALGFLTTREAQGVRIGGVLRGAKKPIDVRNSGTTLRLLTCIASLLAKPTTLTAGTSLRERPMRPLLEALKDLGVRTQSDEGHAPITVEGPIRGGSCELPGDVSSQFLSGLLLAAPLADEATRISITSPLVSRPYVDVTLALLAHHGVRVHEHASEFQIPGRQRIRQKPYRVPGDYSSAGLLLAAAAVTGGRVTLTHLFRDDAQGDRAVLNHLSSFGCHVVQDDEAVTVQGRPLRSADIDVGATPDLFPALAVVAACAQGTSTLSGAPHLRVKESNRIRAMHDNLERFGIRSEELDDGLRVTGGKPRGAAIDSFGDHRIAMALLVLGLRAEGETTLVDPDVVAKSYPDFLRHLAEVAPGVVAA